MIINVLKFQQKPTILLGEIYISEKWDLEKAKDF